MDPDLVAPDWKEKYSDRLCSAEQAVRRIRPGSRVFIGSGCAEPRHLLRALTSLANEFPDTELLNLLTMSVSPYAEEQYADSFRLNAFFIGDNVREAVWKGRADYSPIFLSELPALFKSGQVHLDAALVQVTPPDRHGYCSLGISVDVSKAAIESAEYVIAQVNPHMPRTQGDTFVRIDKLDALVFHSEPLLEPEPSMRDEVSKAIGRNISRLIEDGSTIQVGIGAIPDAVLAELSGHRDLGVHTEMLSDGVMELIEKGVLTNAKKTIHRGKVIASFCMGSRRLYEFVDDNPMFEFHPSEYTNNPLIISQNHKMVAINAALQIDLTGQVCSDSLGHRFYSGIGGQMDFMRGAAMAREGKPIIALPATADGGKKSRIVPVLDAGAGVVTTRGDVHYVVTEFGTAYLHGKSIRERALSLICIAHPAFRNWLLEEAKRLGYIYPDQLIPDAVYPAQYERREKFGELEILFRPVQPTDEDGIKRLFYRMSERSRYLRFFTSPRRMPHTWAQRFACVDYGRDMALVGVTATEGSSNEIVALAQYTIDYRSGMAEAAIMVADEYQGQGIGKFLFDYLVQIARENGVKGFFADVLAQNRAMLNLLARSGYKAHMEQDGSELHLWCRFDEKSDPAGKSK